jgi:hypothetical protein
MRIVIVTRGILVLERYALRHSHLQERSRRSMAE